ncbi:MAG: hypothetical protein U5L95_03265 [Candidatus Saccharibacteria bacterium]|nr:hypothetical protein [Candidatus Saccharibacteria bacterium]
MAKQNLKQLKLRILRVSRLHFYLALILAVQIIVYDAWMLIQPETVFQRWIATAILFAGATVVWLLARSPSTKIVFYERLVSGLIVLDVLLASFMVYQTRGMASTAVALYVVPILVAAVFHSRVALIATSFLCVAAYTTTALAYFTLNFNEGYNVELYGTIGFYSAFMVLVAMIIWGLQNPSKND